MIARPAAVVANDASVAAEACALVAAEPHPRADDEACALVPGPAPPMFMRSIFAAFVLLTMARASEQTSLSPMAPARLMIAVPQGWSRQPDPRTGAVYLVPPNARSVNDASLVVFPAHDFSGTAEQFHSRTLATVLGASRQLEPVAHGPAGPFLVSVAHFVTPQGSEVWMTLYTAVWAGRAQACLFCADRAVLYKADSPAANQAVVNAHVPGVTSPARPDAQAQVPAARGSGPVPPSGNRPAVSATSSSPPAADGPDGDFMPVLEYSDPPNFWRGGAGGKSYAEYQGREVNFVLCVYPFREFQGDARAAFQQTLLRDWIDVLYREEGIASQPQFSANSVPGADAVIDAQFQDVRQQVHKRVLIVAGHWAAIVDAIAPTPFAWQKAYPAAAEMLKSMRVGRKAAPPSLMHGPGAEGARLAGLFQGMKNKFTVNLMLGPGYGSPKLALHYFLFSADGRVYRCYDFPPGGSEAAARQFDFDAAARQDPGNAGRFAVHGNELYIKMGGPNADEITATVSDATTLQLDGVTYSRKQ